MEEKNLTPTLNTMSLEFFAQHFGFAIENLEWGVIEVEGINIIETFYVVLVKNRPLYIDIMGGKIKNCVDTSACTFKKYPCKITEHDQHFGFVFEDEVLFVNKNNLAAAYADRVYSADTEKYLLGAFGD